MSAVIELKPPKLSPQRLLFCTEYLIDLNGTQAAIRAGYSPKSAYNQANRLMSNDDVKRSINSLKQARAQRLRVDGDEVLQNWVLLSRGNVADFLPNDHPLKGMTRDQLYALPECVTEVSSEKEGEGTTTVKIKLDDRLRASEMVAKHIGLFEADNRQKKADVKMTEEEAQARIVAVLERMKAPPVQIEGDVEDGEYVVIPE